MPNKLLQVIAQGLLISLVNHNNILKKVKVAEKVT